MKLLMTDDLKFSAVDTEKKHWLEKEMDNTDGIVTHTAKTAFKHALGEDFDIPNTNTLDDNLEAFKSIQSAISNNDELIKKFDIDFIRKLKRAKPTKLIQKAVYEIEDGENFDDIFDALKNEESGAIFRKIVADKEKQQITVYSTRFGIWDSFDGWQIKQNETNGNKLRINLADRQASDITKLQDVSRQNYPVATDLRNLFKKGLIQEFKKDDNYIVKAVHFKKEITDEDVKEFEKEHHVKKEITKETSHTSKTNATPQEAIQAIENNDKEIHSVVENVEIDEVEKYETKRAMTAEELAKKLQKDLEEQQRLEMAKLEEKIKIAKNERKKAKEDAIKLMAGGMTLEEAINELGAKKYNDITIQFVVEDLKTEIIDSVQKEAELKKTSQELEKTVKKLDETERKRVAIYKNYTEELERRKTIEKQAKLIAYKLKEAGQIIEEDKKVIKSQTLQIVDLNDTKRELEETVREKEEEIDYIEAEIVEKDKNIKQLTHVVQEKEKEIDYIEAELIEKDESIKQLTHTVQEKDEELTGVKTENTELKEKLEDTLSKLEEMMKLNDETARQLQDLKGINKALRKENEELKDSLNHLKTIEAELKEYKKNSQVNKNLKEHVQGTQQTLTSDESKQTFDEIMKKLDEEKSQQDEDGFEEV